MAVAAAAFPDQRAFSLFIVSYFAWSQFSDPDAAADESENV